jgi:hypothetical protein
VADDPLALDRDAMRRMGYQVVDLLVEPIASLRDQPVMSASPAVDRAIRRIAQERLAVR